MRIEYDPVDFIGLKLNTLWQLKTGWSYSYAFIDWLDLCLFLLRVYISMMFARCSSRTLAHAWWHKSAVLGGQANRWHLCTYQFSASNVASRAGSRGHSNSNYTQFLVSMNQIFSHPCSLIIGQCSYSPICFMTFEILPDSAYASRAGTEELLWQKCFPFGKTAWRTE